MSSSKNNQIYKKTSFLAGINSDFLDKYYSIYLTNPNKIPKDTKAFFDGLNEEIKIVSKNLSGPSCSPKKNYQNGLYGSSGHW